MSSISLSIIQDLEGNRLDDGNGVDMSIGQLESQQSRWKLRRPVCSGTTETFIIYFFAKDE